MTRFRSAVVAFCVGACLAAGEAGGYRLVRDFFHPPPGLKLGAVSGVATDAADNLYVLHRGDPKRPLLVFDREGAFVRSFGDGLFTSTHGLRIDRVGNVCTTDNADHTVRVFS